MEVKSEEQKSMASVTSDASENMVGFKDQRTQKLRLTVSRILSLSLSLSPSLPLLLPNVCTFNFVLISYRLRSYTDKM